MMTEDRFEHLLDAYGADFNRWPADLRDAARVALASSARLQTLWAEADALDDALHLAPVVPSAVLRERILASAYAANRQQRRWRKALFAFWSGAGVAATAVAGAAMGMVIAHQMSAPGAADTVIYHASLQGEDDTDLLGVEMAALDMPR